MTAPDVVDLVRNFASNGFKYLFRQPDNLRDLLTLHLPGLAGRLDYDKAQEQPTEVKAMWKSAAEALIEEGMLRGEIRTRRDLLLRILRHHFGPVPRATLKRINATADVDLLRRWFDQALAADKLADINFDPGA